MVAKPNASSSATAEEPSDAVNPEQRPSGIAPAATRRLAPPLLPRPFDFKEAYHAGAADRAGLDETDILVLGPFDIGYAVKVALGSVPRLDKHRDLIAQRFEAELAEIDKIDTYTRGVAHAEVLLAATMTPPDKVQALYETALTARRLLTSDLNNVVTQGLVSDEAPKRISGEAGHINVARDIQTIATILTEGGEEVMERVAPPEKLAEYQHLAYQLVELSARRNSKGLTTEQARDELNRALTLLLNAYAIAERVMSFLLWKDKAWRQVVPSLYASTSKPRKDSEVEAGDTPAIVAAPTLPGSGTALDVQGLDLQTNEPVSPGVRGGSPFGGTQK